MESRNSVIAKNSVYLTIRMFLVLIVSLFTTRVLLHSLGVIDYGVYNAVCGFVSMFAFLNTSMTNGIQRFYNYSLGNGSEFSTNDVFLTSIKIQVLIAIVLIVLTETFGLWYINNKMVIPLDRLVASKWIFQFSIIAFLFVIIQAPFSASIMAHEHMNYYAFVSVLDAFLKLIIALSLKFFSSDHLIVYGALLLCNSLISFLLYFIYSRKRFPEIRLNRISKKNLFASMLSFSGWNIFGSFSGMMKDQGINLVLNFFVGPIVNAAKGVASQVNGALQGVVANLTVAIRPQVIQSYASGNVSRTMRLTYSISKINSCVLYFVSWPIVLEIDYILSLWLEDDVPDHTAAFVVLVLLITFVNSLNSAISGVIHASGKMMLYQVVSSSISVLCVPAAYIALRAGGQPEVAFVWTFVFTSISHIAGLFVLRSIIQYSLRDYVKKILQPFLILVFITFAFPLIPHYLMQEGLFRLFVVVLVSSLTVAPVFYFLSLEKKERNMLNSFIKSIIHKEKNG